MLNFKNLFSKENHTNYNLNYDFKSIKLPQKKCSHIAIFTGGNAPQPKDASCFFKNSSFPDYIIAADSGLDSLENFKNFFSKNNILPNAILGDMDSIKNKSLIKKFAKNAQIEKFDPYKDFTDTELALILAKKVGAPNAKVTLLGGGGGRIDHLLGIFDLFSSPVAPDFWLSDSQILIHLKKDCAIKLLPKKQTSPISVMRTTFSNSQGFVESLGLEWESDKFRKIGMPSISNVISKTNFKNKEPVWLKAKKSDFVVAVDFDCSIIKE